MKLPDLLDYVQIVNRNQRINLVQQKIIRRDPCLIQNINVGLMISKLYLIGFKCSDMHLTKIKIWMNFV